MAQAPQSNYPGGSKSRVSRAGAAVREGRETAEDLAVIDTWRAAHRAVLNTFQAILRARTRGTGIVVAQRHKRRRTIVDKLTRLPRMELARMDDIAGCRLIFPDTRSLYEFRERVHAARFKHRRRNEDDKYDYIKAPKTTGYRGIHDVYEYDVSSEAGKDFKGLYVELQYRTAAQHAWATAVEVVGFLTDNQPKFQRGDVRYEQAMALASEIIARVHEGSTSCFPDISDGEVFSAFLELEGEIGLLKMLRGLNAADREITRNRNIILIFPEGEAEVLETLSYRDAPDALRALFQLEAEHPGKDIVLVRADTSDEIRIAFRNYFSDAGDFIRLVEAGCDALAGRSVVMPASAPLFDRDETNTGR